MTFPFKTLRTVSVSAGSDSAGQLPLLNDDGVLDTTLLNGVTTTDGTADAGKTPILNADGVLDVSLFKGITSSAGTGSSGSVPVLDASGLLDKSFLASLFSGGGSSTTLDAFGWRFQIGTATIPASGDHTFSFDATFPEPFGTCFIVIPVLGAAGVTPNGFIPAIAVTAKSATGFTLHGDIDSDTNPSASTSINVAIPLTYLAIGTPAS